MANGYNVSTCIFIEYILNYTLPSLNQPNKQPYESQPLIIVRLHPLNLCFIKLFNKYDVFFTKADT